MRRGGYDGMKWDSMGQGRTYLVGWDGVALCGAELGWEGSGRVGSGGLVGMGRDEVG